jgi:hypothetical protein
MTVYTYEVSGTAAGGQTWKVTGEVEGRPGDFPKVPDAALRNAFDSLTEGKAVFGQPGVGCNGPYVLTRLLIEAK